ncbi:MAG TPA: tetratricopeptide repeat protein [Candidatus Angelobacter sp.]|nr:tetratricopeptide repeat protein [Candidatus Angelobacter sp.]
MLLVLACCFASAHSQEPVSNQRLMQEERWPELVQRLAPLSNRSAEQEYEYGIALAHLEQWDQASAALLRGSRLQPTDKRFPIELGGIAFKQKRNRHAISYLHRALRLDPKDDYANEFLATIYFLQGNLEAAVKYWNRISTPKPKIAAQVNESSLRIRPALLDHTIAFSSGEAMRLTQLRSTDARLQNLEIFPSYRMDLVAQPDGSFDSVLRAQELNGFGTTRAEALLRTFRGLPFQEITPEYDNVRGSATNVIALARWDPDKRRYGGEISGSPGQNPQWRYLIGADVRNENWAIRNGFRGPAPVLGSLNLRREAGLAQINRLIGWRGKWSLGAEFSHRDFRSLVPGVILNAPLLAEGFQIKQTATVQYQILRTPEHRLEILSGADSQAGKIWSGPSQSFEKLQGWLNAYWFPQARGDDFETVYSVRAGKTFGQLPFDELFMLGLERDNDPALWMRAHIGTRNGEKGSAPLGKDFFLSSWETDKNLYSNGLLTVRLGPFVDTGKISDPGGALGSKKWLTDTGAEAKLRVLGVGVALVYGKDLRTGNNAFYVTLAR